MGKIFSVGAVFLLMGCEAISQDLWIPLAPEAQEAREGFELRAEGIEWSRLEEDAREDVAGKGSR